MRRLSSGLAALIIVGSGRSGTSMMQNLLAFDPANRTPKHWEGLFPCPLGELPHGNLGRFPLAADEAADVLRGVANDRGEIGFLRHKKHDTRGC